MYLSARALYAGVDLNSVIQSLSVLSSSLSSLRTIHVWNCENEIGRLISRSG